MTALPQLWLVAGPNGAGKTTLVQRGPLRELLPSVFCLNPDDRTLGLVRAQGFLGFASTPPDVLNRAFVEAANATFAEATMRLESGEIVCVETVLSTDKYCGLVERVRDAGGRFFLIYVALRSAELAAERVRHRTRLGGHDVPLTKVRERWHRSLERLAWFAARATRFWVYDNSDSDPENPPALLAEGKDGICLTLGRNIPQIAAALEPLCRQG